MSEKESEYENYEELPKINKFVGESFGTDNVRTVYAGESRQIPELESRVIILVGPMNAGKTSLIDFMCNLFYGADFNSNVRYKIANEKFDATTPTKSIIKYVFNGTKMSYRPIVIDTPGIGHPSGIKTNVEMASHITEWLYFDPRSRIHAVGLVIPSYIHSITAQMDSDLQRTLQMFPEWMRGNIVPLITYSEGNADSTAIILRHFNLHNNAKFRLNTSSLYAKPSSDPIQRHLQHKYWDLTMQNLQQFFEYVSILHPQCMEERLPPWESSDSPVSPSIPRPLPSLGEGDLPPRQPPPIGRGTSSPEPPPPIGQGTSPPVAPPLPPIGQGTRPSNLPPIGQGVHEDRPRSADESQVSTPATIIERKRHHPDDDGYFPYSPPLPKEPPPSPPLPRDEDIRGAPPLPPRIGSPISPRRSIPEILIPEDEFNKEVMITTTSETTTRVISNQNSPISRQTETHTTTIRRERDEEVIEQTSRPTLLPLGDERRSRSALDDHSNSPKSSETISIKRYTYDPFSKSYKMQSMREQKVFHASASSTNVSRSRDVSPMPPPIRPILPPVSTTTRDSLYERISAQIDESRIRDTLERSTKDVREKSYKETHINGFTDDQSPTKDSTSSSTTPTTPNLARVQYETSARSSASEWLYSPSRTSDANGTLPKPDVILYRPQSEGVITQSSQTTVINYDQPPPLETPPRTYSRKSYDNVYELARATDEISAQNEMLARSQSRQTQEEVDVAWRESQRISVEKQRSSNVEETKQASSPAREPLFERNTSARQSYHSNSFKRARRAAQNSTQKRPDTDYDDNWDSDIESARVPIQTSPKQYPPQPTQQPLPQQPQQPYPQPPPHQTSYPLASPQQVPPKDYPKRREPSPPRVFTFPDVNAPAYGHSPRAPLITEPGRKKMPDGYRPDYTTKRRAQKITVWCIDDLNKCITMCFLVCIPIFIVVVLVVIILFLIFEH